MKIAQRTTMEEAVKSMPTSKSAQVRELARSVNPGDAVLIEFESQAERDCFRGNFNCYARIVNPTIRSKAAKTQDGKPALWVFCE